MKSVVLNKFLLCLCSFKEQHNILKRYQLSWIRSITKNRPSTSKSSFFRNKFSSFKIKNLLMIFRRQTKLLVLITLLKTLKKNLKLQNHIFTILKTKLAATWTLFKFWTKKLMISSKRRAKMRRNKGKSLTYQHSFMVLWSTLKISQTNFKFKKNRFTDFH